MTALSGTIEAWHPAMTDSTADLSQHLPDRIVRG